MDNRKLFQAPLNKTPPEIQQADSVEGHSWLLSGSETNLARACESVTHSLASVNSSQVGSIRSFIDDVSKCREISMQKIDRLSYICSHQGPHVISSPSLRRTSNTSHTTGSSMSIQVPLAQWDSCSMSRTDEALCESLLQVNTRETDSTKGSDSPRCSFLASPSSNSKLYDSCNLMCRICHGGDEDEPLMVTCRCTGTVKYAHQNCVLNWISKSGNQYCELCKYKYKTKRKKIKSLWKWQFPSVSTKGWLHIGLFIAFVTMLLTSITWIVWSRVSSTPTAVAERTTDEVKFAYMLNGLFIALAIGGLYFDSYRHVRRYFQRWSVLNRHMIIEPYCDQDSLTERTVSSLKTAVSIEQRPGSEASIAIDIAEGPTEPREKQQQNKSKRGNGTWV